MGNRKSKVVFPYFLKNSSLLPFLMEKQMNSTNLTLKDFHPCNTWTVDVDGEKYPNGQPKYVTDETTGRQYLRDPSLRLKLGFMATVGCPLNAFGAIYFGVGRLLRVVVCYDCCCPRKEQDSNRVELEAMVAGSFTDEAESIPARNCNDRVKAVGMEVVKLALTPITFLGMQLSALYGCLISPNDGRKLWVSFGKIQYMGNKVSCCMDPFVEIGFVDDGL